MKPIIIYISGAPGSGKTTLAKQLSKQLNLHHISSDLIHGGVAYTNPTHNRGDTVQNIFVPHLVGTAKQGISFIVDHVLQKNIAKETIIDKLLPYAHVIYMHTQAIDPIARYKKRLEEDGTVDMRERRDFLLSRAEFHTNNLKNTNDPIELGIPRLIVDANDGYNPSLEEIIQFVKNNSQLG